MAGRPVNMQVVDIPIRADGRGTMWGRFSEALTEVEKLPDGKCLKLGEMDESAISTLRSAAKVRKLALHIRTTPDATFIWVNRKSTERKRKA